MSADDVADITVVTILKWNFMWMTGLIHNDTSAPLECPLTNQIIGPELTVA